MAEIKKHSLDGTNEEAVKKLRRLIEDFDREEQEKNKKKISNQDIKKALKEILKKEVGG